MCYKCLVLDEVIEIITTENKDPYTKDTVKSFTVIKQKCPVCGVKSER